VSTITPAIRLAHPHDAAAVRTLVRAAYAPWIELFGREPSPIQDDYHQRIADGEVWLLEDDGALIGCVMLRDGPQALMLPNIAVAPAAQGKGYGRQLLTFAEMEARRRGYEELRLFVNTLMTENIALYRHLGFVQIERIQTEDKHRSYLCLARPVGCDLVNGGPATMTSKEH
jgi:ribosomal protein S18 acetylase RimI-like enzyme